MKSKIYKFWAVLIITLTNLLISSSSWAQIPEKISYQAVIRNSSNQLVNNQAVGIRISILHASPDGTVVYSETQNPVTNTNGLISIEIGEGSEFENINWANGPYFLKTETDPTGGTNYNITGTSQILSVPYALHAKTAESFAGNELFFEDNGQIASFDDNHRIMFRRNENILELREYGKIIFSPGAFDGNATNQMTLMEDGNIELNNKNLRNLADPLYAQDAATKAYVDANDGFSGDYNDLINKPGNVTTTSDGFMSSADKVKLNGITAGAEVNVNADWNAASGDAKILNKPDLSVYATKNMGNQNIINLANPVNAQDAATKAYVDGASGIIETDPTWYGTADTLSAIGRKGKVGIGIFAPAAPLHVHGALTGGGNVLFTGEFKSNSPGNPPVSGSGTRMMWYPDKAAFRAGCVIGNNWSRDSVGNYSVAMGHNTKAKGSYSIAIGHVAIASGDNSLATGYNTLASGQYSTAMGARSEATGELSTAMGIYTTAPSYNEMVIGRYNTEYTPLGKRTWETTDRLFVIGIGTGNTTRRNAITVLKDGNTGLGTDTPSAPLHVNGTGSGEGNVLFTGSYKSSSPGDPPASGAGTRMMWYPDKAAFRAGGVDDANWDKDSIGYFSVAFGYNTKAKGNHSITMGHYTTASGFYSTAMGTSTNASGSSSTAMGFSTTASGSNSTAMGGYTTASGHSSTAMGTFTNASGSYSTAMGYKANAIGNYSFAINLSNETGPNLGANAFRISGAYTIGGNLAWTNYSDRRLKKDIQVLSTENNLTKIMQMNGVRFRWKDNDSLLNLGFIAQDVNDIIPESVRYDELNDIYSMEYTAIIPVLVEGIKEQQKIIEELKARIEALEKQRP